MSSLIFELCCSSENMSGVNGNVIMSGYGDDNPDNERREAARDRTYLTDERLWDQVKPKIAPVQNVRATRGTAMVSDIYLFGSSP